MLILFIFFVYWMSTLNRLKAPKCMTEELLRKCSTRTWHEVLTRALTFSSYSKTLF